MQVTLIKQSEVEELLDMDQLLEVLAAGFRALSSDGEALAPSRGELIVPDAGRLLTMPAHAHGHPLGVKLVTVFPDNPGLGIPSHLALITLMDPETGAAQAIMDGTHITAVRTAGAAALAARLLARPESRVMTILGAGVQGRWHLDIMARHFDLDTIYIGSLYKEDAARLATRDARAVAIDDFEEAVRRSDIVCLCSHADEPLILNSRVEPGQHISSVGYSPPGGELDPAIARGHRVFVESRVAFDPPPAGCAELAGLDRDQGTELGEVLLGSRPGRETADQVTVYKAMGHAIEDLVVANLVYRVARENSRGQLVEL